jgi:hypothetical protein
MQRHTPNNDNKTVAAVKHFQCLVLFKDFAKKFLGLLFSGCNAASE